MRSFKKLFAITLVTFAFAACSQEKYEPAEKAAGEMTAAAADLGKTQANIGATLTALNNLSSSSGGDLRSKYDAFSKSLDKLKSSARDTEAKANDMRKRGDAYFANWDKENAAIKNEDIRARSEARQTEVKQHFKDVSDLYQQAKAEFMPFMSNLNDIHTALGSDLTPAGLNSVRDVVSRATSEGNTLQNTIQELAAKFKTLGASVSPKGA
jgi:hypothetical protein